VKPKSEISKKTSAAKIEAGSENETIVMAKMAKWRRKKITNE
jgi:hypothetical protein